MAGVPWLPVWAVSSGTHIGDEVRGGVSVLSFRAFAMRFTKCEMYCHVPLTLFNRNGVKLTRATLTLHKELTKCRRVMPAFH